MTPMIPMPLSVPCSPDRADDVEPETARALVRSFRSLCSRVGHEVLSLLRLHSTIAENRAMAQEVRTTYVRHAGDAYHRLRWALALYGRAPLPIDLERATDLRLSCSLAAVVVDAWALHAFEAAHKSFQVEEDMIEDTDAVIELESMQIVGALGAYLRGLSVEQIVGGRLHGLITVSKAGAMIQRGLIWRSARRGQGAYVCGSPFCQGVDGYRSHRPSRCPHTPRGLR